MTRSETARPILLSLLLAALVGFALIFGLVALWARNSVLNRVMVRDDLEARKAFVAIQDYLIEKQIDDLSLSTEALRRLDKVVKVSTYGRGVTRIRLFNLKIQPVYASDLEDLSIIVVDDRDSLEAALRGITRSAVRGTVGRQGGEIEFYSPLHDSSGKIIGAGEVYFDMSQVVQDFNSAAKRLFWVILGFFLIFSFVLFLYSERLLRRMELERTDKRMHEERAKSLQLLAQTGVMVSGLAHQLRNPVSVLKGISRSLRKRLVGSDTENFVTALEQETTRISDLIEEFLRFAKPVDLPKNGERVEVSSAIKSLESELRQRAPNLELRASVEAGISLPLSPVVFQELLLNLGHNALDSQKAKPHPVIEVSASKTAKGARLSFRDHGSGWPVEVLNDTSLVFQPFFTTKSGGTGLGLPMCKRIVESIGGSISIKAAQAGGAQVEFEVPLAS